MDAAEATEWISNLAGADVEPTLSTAQLSLLLKLAATTDADGNAPTHEDWTPTYSLRGVYLAAREGLDWRAAKASGMYDFTTDGQSFRRLQVPDNIQRLRENVARKLATTSTTG